MAETFSAKAPCAARAGFLFSLRHDGAECDFGRHGGVQTLSSHVSDGLGLFPCLQARYSPPLMAKLTAN